MFSERIIMMVDNNLSLDYLKYAYSELLPVFMDELINAGGDYAALTSANARLCDEVLGYSKKPFSFAVVFTSYTDFSSKLDMRYFKSNVASGDIYQNTLESMIGFLAHNPVHTSGCFELSETGKTNYDIEGNKLPESILVVPICTLLETCGYTIIYYYDNEDRHDTDSPKVSFLYKAMHLLALALQCEFNKAILDNYLMSDNLTGLPNREHIYGVITSMLQKPETEQQRFALMYIRINGLKNINNSLGIITGDLLLKATGTLIQSAVKNSIELETFVGRLGGGDFVVLILLPPLDQEKIEDEDYEVDKEDENVIRVCCNAIIAETSKHIEINGYKLYPSANIGACIYPLHGHTAEELLRKADLAQNDAKREGLGTFSTYQSFMDGDAEEILFLSNNLPTAIPSNQFEMFYQAMVDVKTGKALAAEALIRWWHPERGLIFPDRFMPFAERNAYGVQIDLLVLNMACKQIKKWQKKGIDLIVSINTSPKHFMNGLIHDSVKTALETHDVDPSKLRIEILENILLDDFKAAIKMINDLRALGVEIALDDFGAGYSSLEYVAKLPMDYLKIDRSFMMNMKRSPDNKIIMKTILTLAKGLNVKTVAEGVEHREDFEFLRDIGCEIAQGYFINKPMSVDSFEHFIEHWRLS